MRTGGVRHMPYVPSNAKTGLSYDLEKNQKLPTCSAQTMDEIRSFEIDMELQVTAETAEMSWSRNLFGKLLQRLNVQQFISTW